VSCQAPVRHPLPAYVASVSGPHRYRIRVSGQLDPSWAETLGGCELVWDDEDNTVLTCDIVDQSALHGLLTRLFDLGSLLLSVTKEASR
jgi:hypothetical protein